jgi:N-acyl-phosphatidylethanolamine-hydrolysing phospholipase D
VEKKITTSWKSLFRKPCLIGGTVVFSCLVSAAAAEDLESLARARAHHKNPGFTNPWLGEKQPGGLLRFLKWRFSSNPFTEEKRNRPVFRTVEPDLKKILTGGGSITYLGHGTLWIRLRDQNILTDPIFGDIAFFLRRFAPFPLPPEALPRIQVVLISHSHLDHLDKESLRRLGTDPLYLVPLGHRDWFEKALPGAAVVELDWFETYSHKGLLYRFLPAQHWSKRTPFDTNRRLWGTWLIEGGGRKIFYAGDSGYFRGFAEFGEKFGPIDAALLPIAAYEPRWFMSVYHMNPDEAVKAFLDLRAQHFIPQQWGVFDLTDEPMDAPARAYREAAARAGLPEERTPLLLHGETWFFPKNR